MLIGIGIDLLKVSQIASSVQDPRDPFVQRCYTKREQALIQGRSTPLYSYATRFAGKEAVFKTLSVDGNALRLNEIEILETASGQPTIELHGHAKDIARQKGISRILISLSYDTDYAIAYATAVSEHDTKNTNNL